MAPSAQLGRLRRTTCLLLALALFPLSAGASLAEPPTPPTVRSPSSWTVDDVILAESASSFHIAPDCRQVVWVKSVPDNDKGETASYLMRTSLGDGQEVQLTRGSDGCDHPRWSPDGKRIAFLTTRPTPLPKPAAAPAAPSADRIDVQTGEEQKTEQLWLINPFGGEPWPLTDLKRGIQKYEWMDADTILYTAQEDPALYETSQDDQKDDAVVVEDEAHEPPVRLFKVAVSSGTSTRLTENTDRILDFALSPDGRHAVTVHDRSLHYKYDNRIRPVVYLYDLGAGTRQELFTDPKFHLGKVCWARDGKGFYATNQFTSSPRYLMAFITEVYYYDLAAGAATRVDLDWDNGLAMELGADEDQPGLHVTADGFVALLADGVHDRAARYRRTANGWQRQWLTGEHHRHLFGLEVGRDDQTLVYAASTAGTPTEWYAARLDGTHLRSPSQLTARGDRFKDKVIARTEVVRWKGAQDEEVEGLLYYPHQYEAGKKYPLVVMIHGGPAEADLDAWAEDWAHPANLLNQRGAFVLKPNYHGSANYGLKWVESVSGGKYYDLEVPDIEKGVDALIARGLVDPDRLGVQGWSNGAILAIALTVTTTRYKAAAADAGDVDWPSDWGACAIGGSFDSYYLGKSPLDDPQLWLKKSPFYRLDRVRTPTLIFFGTEDHEVPTNQGWMHYRALQQSGKADVRFLLFPGESHALTSLVHQRRKVQEELAWFDKYLFRTTTPANEALKPSSPLAHLLALKGARRDGSRYGVADKGRLIPETVAYQDLQVGRFEVTQAQYAAFDRNYPVEAGRENYPAHGITFAQARAYCTWLSQATGRTYRLPDEAEAEALYGVPDAADNTLDAWAGYPVNPDDAVRLRAQLKELGGGAPLLKEVGSGQGTDSEKPVFDLGGNVAEWVVTHDGKGRPFGGSADTAADVRLRERHPAPEYVGFRVIQGTAGARK